jgi:2'-hydroxyisoflavone reductase
VQAIVGDRASELSALAGKSFDAVIDTYGYAPVDVRKSALALKDVRPTASSPAFRPTPLLAILRSVRSTRSPTSRRWIPPTATWPTTGRRRRPASRVLKVFGEHALIVRPGLIVGPGDRGGRFSHWPWRALEGAPCWCRPGRRRAAAVHRRARPRRLDRPPGRARRARLQRTGPANGRPAGAS